MNIITTTILSLFILFSLGLAGQESKFIEGDEWQKIINNDISFLLEGDLLISRRNENFIDDSFVPIDSLDYQYDLNENLILTIAYRWEDQELINRRKESQEFDGNNNRTHYLWQDWDGVEWANFLQVSYDYSPDNLLTSLEVQIVDENGNWNNLNYDEFTYNSDGLRIEATRDDWINDEWQPNYIITYTYDDDNNLIETQLNVWNSSEYANSSKTINEYDNQQNLTSILFQNFNSLDQLTNRNLTEFSYNAQNLEVREVLNNWDENQQDWVFNSSWDSTYDGRENLSTVLIQRWSTDDSIWEFQRQDYYFYLLETSLQEIISDINFEVSPNPSNGNFEISFDNINSDQVQLEVYAIDGKKVKVMNLDSRNGKSTINLSHLEKGNYVLKINTEKGSSSKKIFINK